MKGVKITHYTEREAGLWLRWPKNMLSVPVPKPDYVPGGNVLFSGLPIHSLKYSDGREWDVINGWRTTDRKEVLE